MSHIFKSGNSVFTTNGSIIRIRDYITTNKEPINIGINNPQSIEFDPANRQYYVTNGSTIKVYDSNFNLIDTITSITGIVSMQIDTGNNRLIVTERTTPSFKSIDLTTRVVTTIFLITGITEIARFGYYDTENGKFYVGTNQLYIFSNIGILTGIITDPRIQNSNITNVIRNPHTGLLMISINNKILLADPITLSVQQTAITGTGVDEPGFIRFDPINHNSYWLCNPARAYISEMLVGTNAAKRVIALGNSTPYGVWVENSIDNFSLIIADAGWNQFYRLKERLV